MVRRLSVIAAVLLLTQSGCRSRCDGHRGFFTANTREPAPCQTVGRGSGCFDAATGLPVACPTGGAAVMPNPAFPGVGPRLEELPPPNPSNLIPNPAVPVPAPAGEASLPFPSSPGTPVKTGTK